LFGLPADGSVPGLPMWQYIHTPGHAPGHISLFRQSDGVLIAGDAFVTTKQESAIAVMRQTKILSGPPKYFTYDWDAAEQSVKKLQALNPAVVATGHGKPMQGERMVSALKSLAEDFRNQAVPPSGRYVHDSAVVDDKGVNYVPPPTLRKLLLSVGAITVAIAAGSVLLYCKTSGRKRTFRSLF
jgi:glyoxylase-like metal-dependent hydrolase (beta-lactamase superfamily II)